MYLQNNLLFELRMYNDNLMIERGNYNFKSVDINHDFFNMECQAFNLYEISREVNLKYDKGTKNKYRTTNTGCNLIKAFSN